MLFPPQEGKTGGRVVGGKGQRAASHTHGLQNRRAKSLWRISPPSYLTLFPVTEVLKVVFKEMRVPKNVWSLAFLQTAIGFDFVQANHCFLCTY